MSLFAYLLYTHTLLLTLFHTIPLPLYFFLFLTAWCFSLSLSLSLSPRVCVYVGVSLFLSVLLCSYIDPIDNLSLFEFRILTFTFHPIRVNHNSQNLEFLFYRLNHGSYIRW